ncbi:MAG: hypothetical protein ACO1RT_19180 [Planctomycetaceae bacterium]
MVSVKMIGLAVCVTACSAAASAKGQQVTTTTPSQSLGSGFFEGNFVQGSSRTISSATPSLTTMNGYPGSFFSGQVRPFVTGITPVVGSYPMPDQSLGVLAAADQRAKLSAIAEANAKRQNDRLQGYLLRAERAEAEGNLKMARANYRWAAELADPTLRTLIQTVLRERFSGRATKTAK